MRKFVLTITAAFLLSMSFWSGTKIGHYLSGVERENLYPFNLGEVWVGNQPTCDDYNSLAKGGKTIFSDVVKDSNNKSYVRVTIQVPYSYKKQRLTIIRV